MEIGSTSGSNADTARGTVERSIWIAAPVQRVWQAVTEGPQLSQWFGGGGATWEIPVLAVGGTANYYEDPSDIAVHTIVALDPLQRFGLRWESPGHEAEPAYTLVTTFSFVEEGDGTRVTVTEAGYETLPGDLRRKRLSSSDEGYRRSLDALKAYVESTTP